MSNIHYISNTSERDDFFAAVEEMGAKQGEGEDQRAILAVATVTAAAEGLICIDQKSGVNDAKPIYEAYVSAKSKRAQHTDGGKAANVSKLAALIKMGAMTSIDGVEVINRAQTLHKRMRAEGIKTKAAFDAYVQVARVQHLNKSYELTEGEMRDAMSAATKDKDAQTFLKAAVKSLEKALEYDMTEEERGEAEAAHARAAAALNSIIIAQNIAEEEEAEAQLRARREAREAARIAAE